MTVRIVAGVAFAVACLVACGGSTVPVDTCSDTQNDPNNCGTCGHACLGAACSAGVCQSQAVFTSVTDIPSAIAVDASNAYFVTRQFASQTLDAPLTLYRCLKTACSTTLTPMLSGHTGLGAGLATDGSNVYFDDTSSILSCPTSGCPSQPNVIAASQDFPAQIAVAQGRVYWTNYAAPSRVLACPVTGCAGAPTIIADNQVNAWGITADATNIYWTNDVTQTFASGVYSCPLGGCAGSPSLVASNLVNPSAVVSDGTTVFWTDSFSTDTSAYSCPVSGCSGAPNVISPSLTVSTGIAVDANYVYVAGTDSGDQPALVRCAKDGCANGSEVIAPDQPALRAIAVDEMGVYWTTGDGATGGTVGFIAK